MMLERRPALVRRVYSAICECRMFLAYGFFLSIFLVNLMSSGAALAENPTEGLDAAVARHREDIRAPALTVAVIENGQVAWMRGYGVLEAGGQRAATKDTVFNANSIAGAVTAVAVLHLVETAQVRLDNDVSDYLPFTLRNPRHPDTPITLRQLLLHTGGIKDPDDLVETLSTDPASVRSLSAFLGAYVVPAGTHYEKGQAFSKKKPGEEYLPSKIGHALIHLAIERVSGQTFSDFYRDNIFRPLGMTSSSWAPRTVPQDRMARPHTRTLRGAEPFDTAAFANYPGGILHMSIRDLAAFAAWVSAPQKFPNVSIVSPGRLKLIEEVQYAQGDVKESLGWFVEDKGEMQRIGHNGMENGGFSIISYNRKSRKAVVALGNVSTTSIFQIFSMISGLEGLIESLYGLPVPAR